MLRFPLSLARHDLARLQRALVVATAVAALAGIVGAALVSLQIRDMGLAQADLRLAALGRAVAQQVRTSLVAVDELERAVGDGVRARGLAAPEAFAAQARSWEAHLALRERAAGAPQLEALVLLDAAGRVLASSQAWPVPPADPALREAAQAAVRASASAEGADFVHVTPRGSGAPALFVGRVVEGVDRTRVGLVIGRLSLAFQDRQIAAIARGSDVTIRLVGPDGTVLAGRPPGGSADHRPALVAHDRSDAVVRAPASEAGQEVEQPVPGTGMRVIARQSRAVALQGWRPLIAWIMGGTALLQLSLLALVLVWLRQMRAQQQRIREERAAHEAGAALRIAHAELQHAQDRTETQRALERQGQQLAAALDNMLHGLTMFDQQERLVVANRRLNEIAQVPPGIIVPGMTLEEVARAAITGGQFTEADLQALQSHRRDADASRRDVFMWELHDGRTIRVGYAPMARGWVTTFEDVSELRRASAMIEHLAHHDPLTGLPNRLLFRQRLEEALARVRRGEGLALHCLDLDEFKAVNDTLGHPVGDRLLHLVARRLQQTVREIDTVARLGGDEFAILQVGTRSEADCAALAERVRHALSTPFEIGSDQVEIGVSIGIALAPQDGDGADHLMKCADLALYRAKEDRGGFRLFQEEMNAAMQARRSLERDLRQAVAADALALVFQPLVEAGSKRIAGCEALLRWPHAQRGMVGPDQFIPLAEQSGLIVPVGEWVLRTACRTAAGWDPAVRVSVNLSPVQFRHRGLVDAVAGALAEAGLAPERLELEITESAMLSDTATTLAALDALRAMGIRIAMDDFGAGYSSLAYLRRFRFDRIKIDRGFIRDLAQQPDAVAIVRAIVGVGRDLGIAISAEGVETPAQSALLEGLGCDEMQGYLFSPPVEPAALHPLFAAACLGGVDAGTPPMVAAAAD